MRDGNATFLETASLPIEIGHEEHQGRSSSLVPIHPSRCWNGRAVRRNDLSLVGKHLARFWRDQHLDPVDVVVAVGLVVTERFDAREVLESAAGGSSLRG